jgi:hypothetical protein
MRRFWRRLIVRYSRLTRKRSEFYYGNIPNRPSGSAKPLLRGDLPPKRNLRPLPANGDSPGTDATKEGFLRRLRKFFQL